VTSGIRNRVLEKLPAAGFDRKKQEETKGKGTEGNKTQYKKKKSREGGRGKALADGNLACHLVCKKTFHKGGEREKQRQLHKSRQRKALDDWKRKKERERNGKKRR